MDNSTATLLFYLVVMAPSILLGFYFARTKRFRPYHRGIMTAVTVLNWVLILIIMVGSYSGSIAYATDPTTTDTSASLRYGILPTLHLITGGIAQLLATYLVLLMWTEDLKLERLLPFRIKNIKTPMRLTMGLWLTAILLGVAIYAIWRAPATVEAQDTAISTEQPAGDATQDPLSTEEATGDATEEPVATEEALGDSTEEAVSTEEAEASSTESP